MKCILCWRLSSYGSIKSASISFSVSFLILNIYSDNNRLFGGSQTLSSSIMCTTYLSTISSVFKFIIFYYLSLLAKPKFDDVFKFGLTGCSISFKRSISSSLSVLLEFKSIRYMSSIWLESFYILPSLHISATRSIISSSIDLFIIRLSSLADPSALVLPYIERWFDIFNPTGLFPS